MHLGGIALVIDLHLVELEQQQLGRVMLLERIQYRSLQPLVPRAQRRVEQLLLDRGVDRELPDDLLRDLLALRLLGRVLELTKQSL